ncbi:unnamed protein product [marine sediment metagenome]|uniref:Thiamine pyrimidine synthase n=1 Tax=marine sediment metagenome TaxID=412755 RepID=X0U668_9ZZZZ
MLLGLAAGLAACGDGGTSELTPITVQLKWLHQTQFAGFYAADQNGYYADEGLSVTLLAGGANVDLVGSVLDGTAQFGITMADQLLVLRSEGAPVRAIATIYRRSPVVFGSLASSGITRPQDIVGKTVCSTQANLSVFNAMMASVGISADQYAEVPYPDDLGQLVTGDASVWSLYSTGSALELEAKGHQLNYILPDDYGVHFYADTIFASEDLLAADPDLVMRFLRATLKGWRYAVENVDEVAAMVSEYNPDADTALETVKMEVSIPLIRTGEDHIGWMKHEVWAGIQQILREQGMLSGSVDVGQAYDMQFVEEIYAVETGR